MDTPGPLQLRIQPATPVAARHASKGITARGRIRRTQPPPSVQLLPVWQGTHAAGAARHWARYLSEDAMRGTHPGGGGRLTADASRDSTATCTKYILHTLPPMACTGDDAWRWHLAILSGRTERRELRCAKLKVNTSYGVHSGCCVTLEVYSGFHNDTQLGIRTSRPSRQGLCTAQSPTRTDPSWY